MSEVKKLADLAPWPENPRRIEPDALKKLGASLKAHAEMGVIVYNRQLKCLVGGHQRHGLLPPQAKITILQEFDPPLKRGTVALGTIEVEGERFLYREVDLDNHQHALASIAANNRAMQGEFHFPTLADIVAELEGVGVSVKKAGYDSSEVERLLNWTPDEDLTNLETTMVKDPASTIGTYLTNTIKQIILYFGNDEYGSVVDRLDAIAEAEGFANNTAVVMHLLEHYERCTA